MNKPKNATGGFCAPQHCLALSAGDVIQRGDLFRANDGRMLEIDNVGRLLGLRVLGQTIKKGGDWFRPSPNTAAQAREVSPVAKSSTYKP